MSERSPGPVEPHREQCVPRPDPDRPLVVNREVLDLMGTDAPGTPAWEPGEHFTGRENR